jgi:hypothetical protein
MSKVSKVPVVSPRGKRKCIQFWMDAVASEAPGIQRDEIVLEALFYATMQCDPAQVARGWVHWRLQLEKAKAPTSPIVAVSEA